MILLLIIAIVIVVFWNLAWWVVGWKQIENIYSVNKMFKEKKNAEKAIVKAEKAQRPMTFWESLW